MSDETIRKALRGQAIPPRGGAPAERAPPPPQEPMRVPTDEQLARYDFAKTEIRDEGRRLGFAYRRRPLIESLAEQLGLGITDMVALRYYRAAYERADSSPTKSCLDIGAGGGGGNGTASRMLAAIEQSVSARFIVDRCERAIGAVVDTMRAVVIEDQSFSDIAVVRFGSRKQSWLTDAVDGQKVFREKIVPRSGRHREIVAAEFKLGTRRLVDMVNGYRASVGTGARQEPPDAAGRTNAVSAAIMDAVLRTEHVVAIWAAEATIHDLACESGQDMGEAPVFAGIPLLLRSDWAWGWLLCTAGPDQAEEEETCAGAA